VVNNAELIGFGLVRESIHKDLTLTLTKLYDKGDDDLAFQRVFRLCMPEGAAPVVDNAAYVEAEKIYAAALNGKDDNALKSLRLLRNKVLAHTDTRSAKQTAIYRHAQIVLDDSIAICERLSVALGTEVLSFSSCKDVWAYEADRFWRALVAEVPEIGE